MRKIFYFVDVIKLFINHILSLYFPLALLVGGIFLWLHFSKIKEKYLAHSIDAHTTKSFLCSWFLRARDICKEFIWWIIGVLLTNNARFFTGFLFYLFSIDDDSVTNFHGNRLTEIKSIESSGVDLGLSEVYNETIVSNINYTLGIIPLWVFLLLVLAGMTYTFSFNNKMLKNFGVVFIFAAVLILFGGLLLQFWSFELASGLG